MKTPFLYILTLCVAPLALFALLGQAFTPQPVVNSTERTQTKDCGAKLGIRDLALSPDDQWLLATWNLGQARIWNVQTGEVVRTFSGNPQRDMTSVAFSPDGSTIATADAQQSWIWHSATGKQLHTLARDVQDDVATHVTYSNDGVYLLLSGYDGASLWEVSTGQRIQSFPGLQDFTLWQDAYISPDGKYVITMDASATYLWDIDSGEKIHTFDNQQIATFSPDGSKIVAFSNNMISIWDINTFQQLTVFNPVYGRPRWKLSQNGKYMLASIGIGKDQLGQTLVLWNTETGNKIDDFPAHSIFEFLPETDQILVPDDTFSNDLNVMMYSIRNIQSGSVEQTIDLEHIRPTQSQISRSGDLWAIGTSEGYVLVWDLERGRQLRFFC